MKIQVKKEEAFQIAGIHKQRRHTPWTIENNKKNIILITQGIYLYSKVKYDSVTKSSEYRNKNIVTWRKIFSFSL